MPFDLNYYPYPACRRVVMGRRGAVATAQPLGSMAGIEILLAGGNAVDAALAMAIALTVLEPTANGLGSDAFALVWDGQLHGLNASGRSPYALSLAQLEGYEQVPRYGWPSVTVPGAVSSWSALWRRWGSLPFQKLFEPAIRYAEDGFPVSPQVASWWRQVEASYLALGNPLHQPFRDCFFSKGRSPRAGEIWSNPSHAQTLREIAQTEGESFYRGAIANKITAFAAATGGYLTAEDLDIHTVDWVTPISTDYRGLTVWELPPNGQGIAALMALNVLEGIELAQYPRESVESYHWQIEAMKLAFSDIHRHVADPEHMEIPLPSMLDKRYAAHRRQSIGDRACPLAKTGLPQGGTVYLAASDGELMVSFIQSNYMEFGSGIVIPETGIALQNRGAGFVLEQHHPNCLGPHKRPFHTIVPSFLTRNGRPLGPFGVMGGPMQPQGHLQVVVNLEDYGMNPQAALDAPRWRFDSRATVALEQSVPAHIALALQDKGHDIRISTGPFGFGKGQIILRQDNGVLVAASESRGDGLAIAL